ncbi:hypothetical protein Tco_0355764, partial [Tanacetum coccineum]
DKEGVSTDFEKVSTDRPIVSTDGSKVSSDEQIEGTDEQVEGTEEHNEGTEEIFKGTEEQREGIEEKVESTDRQIKGTEDQTKEEIATQASQTSTQTPTSMIFGDDETIATLLLNMSKAKAVLKEKEERIAKEEATNEALIKNFDDIKARIEADRILAEKLQEQEREQFTIEERAKFLMDYLLLKEVLAQQDHRL